MQWPTGGDYVQAIQTPEHSFGFDALRTAEVREGLFGMPASASGQNAIVFDVTAGGRRIAVRCFTHPPESGRHRYHALEQHLRIQPNSSFASALWREKGIKVGDAWWPIVCMDWLVGDTLNVAVEDQLHDPGELDAMASEFRRMVGTLGRDRIAHGDLQHGNVMVCERKMRLVDYDVVWVPGAETIPPHELGHPNYQHPERLRTAAWGPRIDAFSSLVIYASLKALAAERQLWERFHDGENLILGAGDYAAPQDSQVLAAMRRSGRSELLHLAELVTSCSRTPLAKLTTLEGILDGSISVGAAPAPREKEHLGEQWWITDSVETASPSSIELAVDVGGQAPSTPAIANHAWPGADERSSAPTMPPVDATWNDASIGRDPYTWSGEAGTGRGARTGAVGLVVLALLVLVVTIVLVIGAAR